MPKEKAYTDEFKRLPVKLALNSDQSIAQTAKDLGLNIKIFYNSMKLYRESAQVIHLPKSKPSLDEENKRLRKENIRLKEEREILKKAAAFFAKDQF